MSLTEGSGQKPSINCADPKTEIAKPVGPPWLRYVPLLTGVLAGLGGYLTVRGASLTNDAIYRSNQAVLYQAKASDAWNEYQADSLKAHMAQTQLDAGVFVPAAKGSLENTVKKYKGLQPPIMDEAHGHEAKRDDFLDHAGKLLNEKSYLDFAGVAVQLGIALASVAGLTRRKEAFAGGIVCGAAGAGITAYVLIHHFLAK
jgi:hypothetical protein